MPINQIEDAIQSVQMKVSQENTYRKGLSWLQKRAKGSREAASVS